MDRIEFTLPGMLPKMETDGVEPALPPANALVHHRIGHQALPGMSWRQALGLDQISPFSRRLPSPGGSRPEFPSMGSVDVARRRLPVEVQAKVERMLEAVARWQQDRWGIDARMVAERRW